MNRQKLYRRYLNFTKARSVNQIGFLIGIKPHIMLLQAMKPHYDTFYVLKRNGGRRLIENPNPVLKQLQRGLNKYLQCVYYQHCPEASHGFVINIKRGKHRSIISNASTHLGANHIMNIDLKDFFHTVYQYKVDDILSSKLFQFDNETIRLLSSLMCFGGRKDSIIIIPFTKVNAEIKSNRISALDFNKEVIII